jgi:site-specific recombinase XerD
MASSLLAPFSQTSSMDPAPAPEAVRGVHWAARFTQRVLAEQRVSASTLAAYTMDTAMVSRWAARQQLDLPWLTTADLNRYVTERLLEGTNRSTLARHIYSCRCFYAFLVQEGVIGTNPAVSVVVPRVLRQAASLVPDDVLRAVLRAPVRQLSSPLATYRARRDHAIVCTLYGTGLGISDVRLLCWQQIDEPGAAIRVPLAGRKVRSFGLDNVLLSVLKSLRHVMAETDLDPADCAYCFPTTSGLPMTRQGLCQVVRKWAAECGRSEIVTPSALRKTGLTHASERRRLRPAPAC